MSDDNSVHNVHRVFDFFGNFCQHSCWIVWHPTFWFAAPTWPCIRLVLIITRSFWGMNAFLRLTREWNLSGDIFTTFFSHENYFSFFDHIFYRIISFVWSWSPTQYYARSYLSVCRQSGRRGIVIRGPTASKTNVFFMINKTNLTTMINTTTIITFPSSAFDHQQFPKIQYSSCTA